MAAKTAIRRHVKIIDFGDAQEARQISLASDLDALGDAGLIDMEALADPEQAKAVIQEGHDDLTQRPPEGDGDDDGETRLIESDEPQTEQGQPQQPPPQEETQPRQRRARKAAEPTPPPAEPTPPAPAASAPPPAPPAAPVPSAPPPAAAAKKPVAQLL
jgi:outer membrane biosynthesis protein TonB